MVSSAVATQNEYAISIPAEERDLIRQTYGKELNDLEFKLFIAEAEHRGLDIVKGEIKAIRFNGKVSFFPTVHGFTKIAGRHGAFDGIEGPYWCGEDGKWVEVWLDDKKPPAAAKTIVYRKDRRHPTVGVAFWNERKQTYTQNGKTMLMPTWAKMPAHMLAKVSKTDALKASGLAGDEPVWIEEDDEIDGMNIRVVENRRDSANRRLHGAVADAGLGGHAQARALAAQVRPGITSLTDPELTPADMNTAAGLAENLNPEYVEALIVGKADLIAPAEPVEATTIDEEVLLWREQIQDALQGDFKKLSPQLVEQAKAEPWRFIDLIEMAPAEKYVTAYQNAALLSGVRGEEVRAALESYRERKQIVTEIVEADPSRLTVSTWDAFWKELKRRGVDPGQYEAMTGVKPPDYGSPQAALEAYNAAEAEIPSGAPDQAELFAEMNPDRFTS